MTERLAAVPPQRRAQFLARLRDQTEVAAERGPIPRGNTGPAPLSHEQVMLSAIGRQGSPDPSGAAAQSSVSSVPLCLRLRGEVDVDVLRSALSAVVARHEALRTSIVEREGGALQVVVHEARVDLPLIEAPGGDHGERLSAARTLVGQRIQSPLELTRAPMWRAALIRVATDDHLFLLEIPGAVCDARSLELLAHDIAEFWRSERDGDAPQLPGLPVQYPDYALWQQDQLDGGVLDESAGYWSAKLTGAEVLEFPTDRPRGDRRTSASGHHAFAVRRQSLDRAHDLARAEGGSLFDVLAAAFFTLLKHYSGRDDLVLGAPDTNRRHPALRSVIGQFTDMRILRADLSGDPTFRQLVQQVGKVSAEACEHGGLPFDRLLDAVAPAHGPARSPLFQITFEVRAADTAPAAMPGVTTSRLDVRSATSAFDMAWQVTPAATPDADARLDIEFDTGLFDADSVARFARHFDGLLRALTATPDSALSAVPMLSPADQAFLSEIAQGPARPIRESTIVAEFEARVREAPDSTAVVVSDVETSYAELNARANQLAALLRERGVVPGSRVGLCLRRTLDLTTAIFAVLKTGAAYVPLDATHPSGRVAEIAADAQVCAVIAHDRVGPAVSEVGASVVMLDEVRAEVAAMPEENPPLAARPGDVAYVIYTSGSTGKPKGVLLEHRGVVNFVDSTRELFDLTPADRVLGFASVTFDVSVFETFSALLTGARLYLATEDERLSVSRLQSLMERAGITVIDLPPTVMPLLAPEEFTDLRIAFVGGEAFGGELVNRWNPGRRLFNGYGPTECTVTMIVEECAGTWDASPPIGLPMTNHVAHVLDRELRQVPIGVPGELVIGGAGLARGYLDREELTAEKFVADPFGTAPGGRLYRTGDLVKRLADGRLVFLGRLDQQVKIRGLRIELGEVESAVSGFDGIGPVSVRPWTDGFGDKHLVGYLTGIDAEQLPALREYLSTLLPSYMIPSYFVVLAELPLTSSGKVDWRRLPAPDLDQADAEPADEPRTPTERALLHDVLTPLRKSRLGRNEDFFLAGGNSLEAVQLMSAIHRRFGVEIALGDFFASPTVAHLAAAIDSSRAVRRGAADGDRTPVVMRGAGPEQVVLLHPSGGELFCYVPLVRALRHNVGAVGFAADPRDASVDPRDAMAAAAARIARALTTTTGLSQSWCLAGWSYGGVLAFEVARQIERETGLAPPVVLLDAAYEEDTGPLDEATVRRRFVHDVVRLAGREDPAVRAFVADPAAEVSDVREMLTRFGVELELTEPELASRYQTFRSCALSLQAYRPSGPYAGPVRVLAAGPHAALEEQWRKVCTGRFQAESVPGDHYSLFTEPALSRVVAAIEATLAA